VDNDDDDDDDGDNGVVIGGVFGFDVKEEIDDD